MKKLFNKITEKIVSDTQELIDVLKNNSEEKVEKVLKTTTPLSVDRAKEIANTHSKISECSRIISYLSTPRIEDYYSSYNGGWRSSTYSLECAGINPELIENIIKQVAEEQFKILNKELLTIMGNDTSSSS